MFHILIDTLKVLDMRRLEINTTKLWKFYHLILFSLGLKQEKEEKWDGCRIIDLLENNGKITFKNEKLTVIEYPERNGEKITKYLAKVY